MNTKKAKKTMKKGLRQAQKQGVAIRKSTAKKYEAVKRSAIEKGGLLEDMAIKEYENIKKQMDQTTKKAEDYIKKNPAKAALISAGIGAALAAAAALLMSGGKKNNRKKK
ncbi:MAG: hypothetical protein ACD_9C00188G0002 [uncultured bacterium]|nr:MAG: hypothetical protein ACD_9C00188G0002 [uncultured bacterium]